MTDVKILNGHNIKDETARNGLLAKQDIIQYSTMPEASAEYENKTVQYLGNSTRQYQTGCFYKCYHSVIPQYGIDTYIWSYVDTVEFTPATIVPTTTNFVPGTRYSARTAFQKTADLFGGLQGEIDTLETDKQDTLVSGTNIKTINNTSILGSGNINTFPIQTSQAGKFLSTNGTSTSWENLPTATPTRKGIVQVGNALEIDNGVLANKYKYLTSLPDPKDFNQNDIIFCNDEKKILFCSSGVPVGAKISMTPTPSDPAALTVNAVKFYEHLIGSHFNFIGVMPPIEATIEIGMTGWVCECNGYYSATQDPENDFGITIASADDQPGNVIRVRVYNAAGTGHKAWRLWQPTPIEDNLLTNSRTSALSANQGVLLKQMIDQQQALGRFLALWDSDTGTARYLNNGFGYERGDYFIISNIGVESLTPVYTAVSGHIDNIQVVSTEDWVNEMGDSNQTVRFVYSSTNNGWEYNNQYYDMQDLGITYAGTAGPGDIMDITYVNGKNYKPNGDEYTGASTTLTTDPVHVSDMWFYDGGHWVYLENHEVAQIIDSALSPTSENPVQNKVVTNALRNKQDTLTAGDNINISYSDGTCTISSTGGGVGVPEITDVFPITVRNKNALSDEEWKLRYSPIYISTNLTIQQIVENATQQYVTISKYSKNNRRTHGRARGKMTVMNDRRVRLDHKMYCWRKSVNTALSPDNPERYFYAYTDTDDWDDDCSLFASLGVMDCANSATNLNCLKDTGYTMSGFQVDVDFFRYPQGDINTCIREQRDGSSLIDRFIIGTWACSEYRKDGKSYYVWRDSPTSNSVFMYISDSEFIPDYTPKFFDELSETPASTIATYTFVRERKDLNFAKFDVDTYDLSELATDVYFYTVFGQTGDTHMPWDNYWFDFPITPVLLSECKIFIPETTDVSWSNRTMTIKDFIKNLTLSNLEVSDIFNPKDLVKIEIPYDTYYILMRLCAWQKMCFEDDSWSSKFDFQEAINNGAFERRAFGSPRGHTWTVNSEHTAINIYLEFNLAEPDCVVTGKPSRSKPVKKRLRVTTSKGNQTIKD